MQIVCDQCGETGEAAEVRLEEGAVLVVCGACGESSLLGGGPATGAVEPPLEDGSSETAEASEAPAVSASSADASPEAAIGAPAEGARSGAAAPAPTPRDLPPVKCPKCGNRQHDDHACHRCGLVFANAAHQRPWEHVAPEKTAATSEASRLWEHVVAAPTEPGRHADFVEFCKKNDVTGFAAMRYRHWLADHPDDHLAHSYLERVIKDAQAVAQAFAVGDAELFARRTRQVRNLLGLIVALLCFGAAALVLKLLSVQGTSGW